MKVQVRLAKSQRFPGDHPGPRLFLSLIDGFIDTGLLYLSDLTDKTVGATPEDVLREAAEITSSAYYYMSELVGAELQELHYPIVPALQRWFNAVGITNTIVFRAKLEENYELALFSEDDLPEKKRSDSLNRAIQDINWDLLRVTVPSKAFSYLPHMAIVAHEIGHAIYRRLPIQQKSLAASGIEDAVRRRLQKTYDRDRLLSLNLAKDLGQITDYWIQELTADAVGYFLSGPAIFFALSDFFSFRPSHFGYSRRYPPNSLRRKILYDQIRKDNFCTIFKKHTGAKLTIDFNSPLLAIAPDADEIFKSEIRNPRCDPKHAAIFAELPDYILSLVPSIYDSVLKYLSEVAPTEIYSARQLDCDLGSHLDPLLLALPPIEVDGHHSDDEESEIDQKLNSKSPVKFSSILNIGWAALLTKHDRLQLKTLNLFDNEDCEKMERIHGLLIKAVELSEALYVWREREGNSGDTFWERDQTSTRH